jgi:flagellar basal-body rod protein FlgC
MSISISPSVSALNAATMSQNVTAHNVANINTEPYAPLQAIKTEVFPVGTKTTVRQGASGTNDLAKEMTDLNTNKNLYSMNAKAFKMQDRMNGELINLVG